MSFFRAILVLLFGFSPSLLLMGMEQEQKLTTFKYSNPYFDPELQKSLTLIMLKNRNAKEVVDLDKDVITTIAKKSINLHWEELVKNDYGIPNLSFNGFVNFPRRFKQLDDLNNLERIKTFQGKKIEDYDFDFLTMNKEGRIIFKSMPNIIQNKTEFGESYEHKMTILSGSYEKILKLPLRLRSKVGKLCTVKVIEKKEKKESLSQNNPFVVWGGMFLATPAFLSGLAIDEEEKEKRFKVVEKPLITPEEQELLKKAEQEVQEKQRSKEKELEKFTSKTLDKTIKTKVIKTKRFEQPMNNLSQNVQLDHLNLRSRE